MTAVQFMECVPHLDVVHDVLRSKCLLRTGAEGGESESNVDMLEREISHTAVWIWFRVISFESILSTVHFVRTSFAVHLFSTEL